jgi:hypothetical protein
MNKKTDIYKNYITVELLGSTWNSTINFLPLMSTALRNTLTLLHNPDATDACPQKISRFIITVFISG